MKKKSMIKMRAVTLLFAILLVCLGVVNGYGSVCSEGTAEPPFLNSGIDPNLLLILDNSASMYDLAFVEDAKYCYDDTYDPTTNTYTGFFDPDTWYAYDNTSNMFVEKTVTEAATICSGASYHKTIGSSNDICLTLSSGVFSKFAAKGHYLNWAAVSKMDIEKQILTGGKYDTASSALQMETRGCLERRFIKKTDFDSGDHLTLAVRPPKVDEQTSSDDHTTRIEIYPVTANGYEHGSCQLAVEEMQNDSPKLGPLKGYIDDCMNYSGSTTDLEADSRATFNHSVQDCWYIAKFGVDKWLQTDNGSIVRIKGDCSSIYEAPILPWEITPESSGYVCYGDYLKPVTDPLFERGYVGRCWSTGGGSTTETCTDRVCTGEPDSGANPKCIDNKVYQCNGHYNSNKDTCNKDWVVIQDCTGGGGGGTTGWLSDECIEQGMIDFCGTLDFPEVVDPSDQVSGSGDATGQSWNLPAMLVDSGVGAQLGEPLQIMLGALAQSEPPTGLIQANDSNLRIGAMTFNYDGAKSECDSSDPYITYDCTDSAIRDGGQVVVPIDQGEQHSIDLVTNINDIDADTWTPLGEAMYNAVGYYRQDTSKRLDSADFETTTDPVTNWCQSNNILMVTDGAPTADQNSAMISFASGLGYDLGSGTCTSLHGSTYLDDLSKYAYEDVWTDRTFTIGEERRTISTHIVAAGKFRDTGTDKCLPVNLLDAAATSGGTQLYQADDFSQLESALAAAFSNIRAGASAGSAASVISSSRGGEGAIYQAIFWPSKSSSDLSSTAEVQWAGEVHSLFIDGSGYMYEDTNDDRKLTLDEDDSADNDKRVIIYFDDEKLVSRGCYTTPVDGTCSDSVDMDAIHYLWSASDWLIKISNSNFTPFSANDEYLNRSSYLSNARRRYVFTWNDLDNDGIVDSDEVIPFVGWDSYEEAAGTDWVSMSTNAARRSVPNDFNVADDGDANSNVNDIVSWIRGVEIEGSRSRTIAKIMANVSPDPEIVWRLGDVIHSTPTAVARPMEKLHLLYNDTTYAKFVGRWANRRSMVYFGANDGMLHAVNGGFYHESEKKFCLTDDCLNESTAPELGAEMWAYVPYNLLPHLRCLTDSDYNNAHKYYVDQVPRVFDARIFTAESVCSTDTRDPGCIHPYGWGTVLVGSMRFGGAPVAATELSGDAVTPDDDERIFSSSYFVLDITNPEAPPVLLGELTRGANEANLGFTTAAPTPAVMKSDSGAGAWYLLMGSGPQAANSIDAIKGFSEQKPKVAVFPLEGLTTAKEAFRIPDAEPTSTKKAGIFTLSASANGFVSDMITVDYDLNPNYMTDAVYFGTVEHGSATLPLADGKSYDDLWDGQLYRLVMQSVNGDNEQEATTPDQWTAPSVLIDAGQPITAAPSVGTDNNRYWIYFGTGRFFNADIDKPDDAQQSFYGVKEPVDCSDDTFTFTWATVEKSDLYDVTNIEVSESSASDENLTGDTITGLDSLINHIAGSAASCNDDNVYVEDDIDGWYRDFSLTRERNVGQATLLGGLLTFTTYQPFDDPCKQDGMASLYGLHYQSGTAPDKSVFGDLGRDGDTVKPSIDIGRGLATTPNIHVGSGGDGDGDPTAFVQTSTGEIVELPQSNLPEDDFKTGRRSWLKSK